VTRDSRIATLMSDSKLTKKQKKGLAFRQRTVGKRRSRNELMEMETAAIPTMEDQDIASIQSDTLQDQKKRRELEGDETVGVSDQDKQGRLARKGKRTAEENNVLASVEVVKTIKRKRVSGEDGAKEDQISEFQARKVLKRKKNNDVTQSSETKGKTEVKQRFILFVGSRFSCSLQ
jgi:nucleolar protein 6